MKSAIRGILLRPADPKAFEPDAAGGCAPTVFWDGQIWQGPGCTPAGVKAHRMAIALAWDGKPLHHGIAACMRLDDCFNPNELLLDLFVILEPAHPFHGARLDGLTEYIAEQGIGELVLVDEHGRPQ